MTRLDDFTILGKLGEGNQGKVYKVQRKSDNVSP